MDGQPSDESEPREGSSPAGGSLLRTGRGRLRTPVRLLLGAMVVALAGVAALAVGAVLDAAADDATNPAVASVAGTATQIVVVVAVTAGVLVAARLVDRRSPADLGLAPSRDWWADLGFGLALGVALPGLVFLFGLLAGYVRVTGYVVTRAEPSLPVAAGAPPWLALSLVVAYFLVAGTLEEVLFRGYLLVNVAEGLQWFDLDAPGALVAAAVLTSLLFGIGHAGNPAATALALAVICLYGGLLAATFLLTGRLAAAVGIHVGWNGAVSSVFGFPVSGFTSPVTLVAVEVSGPAVVTGGAFGPEGGVVTLVALAVGSVACYRWVRVREGAVRLRTVLARPPAGEREE